MTNKIQTITQQTIYKAEFNSKVPSLEAIKRYLKDTIKVKDTLLHVIIVFPLSMEGEWASYITHLPLCDIPLCLYTYDNIYKMFLVKSAFSNTLLFISTNLCHCIKLATIMSRLIPTVEGCVLVVAIKCDPAVSGFGVIL